MTLTVEQDAPNAFHRSCCMCLDEIPSAVIDVYRDYNGTYNEGDDAEVIFYVLGFCRSHHNRWKQLHALRVALHHLCSLAEDDAEELQP